MDLMRAPLAGGPPQLVVGGRRVVALSCSRPPANRCVATEYDRNQFAFYDLDAAYGKGPELAKLDNASPSTTMCTITADGSFLVCERRNSDPVAIQFLPLGRGQERQVMVKEAGYLAPDQFDPAPDGKGFYTDGFFQGVWRALYIDPEGHVQVLWPPLLNCHYFYVSPDGRHLAFGKWDTAGNVWLLENL